MESNFARAALPCDSELSEITLRNQLNSPLLRLPAEIRNKIYTFVSLSTTIKVTEASESSLLKQIFCLRAPGLVRSCKQIQHEATTLLYSLAIFDITNHSGTFLLDRTFNRNICSLITSIRMSGYLDCSVMSNSDSVPRSWRINRTPTGCLPSLKSLYVQKIFCGWKSITDPAALRKWFQNESLEIIFEE